MEGLTSLQLLLSRKEYTYGDENWKDLLTSYNGQSITYDAQGNPTSYLGHTLTWEKGRQLKSYDSNTYTYNANGIRTSKTVGGIRHDYVLDGVKILRETWDGNMLVPLYDNEDSVCGILYNNEPYYFVKNLQGDVIAIVDKNAETVARYSYDTWGVPTILQDTSNCQIATINPFRYRGYYYDAEIGLYYLQSRYYDPALGRFLNADAVIILSSVGADLFNYCGNNSINRADPMGLFYEEIFSLDLDQYKTFVYICKQLTDGKESKINKTTLDAGLAAMSQVAEMWNFTKLANATNAVGVVLIIYDVATLFFPSYKAELYGIYSMCYELQYRFDHKKYAFDVCLLLGSHSNEIKVEAYQKGVYWSISNCHSIRKETKQFAGAGLCSFIHNNIYSDLRNVLVSMNCRPVKRDVSWKYSYF